MKASRRRCAWSARHRGLEAAVVAIAGEKGGRGVLAPLLQGRRHAIEIGRGLRGPVPCRVVRGIAERPQHARHVAQRTVLGPALRERAGGIALEAHDGEVMPGEQHLRQVIVAVIARAHGGDLVGNERRRTFEQRMALGRARAGPGPRAPAAAHRCAPTARKAFRRDRSSASREGAARRRRRRARGRTRRHRSRRRGRHGAPRCAVRVWT